MANLWPHTGPFLEHLTAQGYSPKTIKAYSKHFTGMKAFLQNSPLDPVKVQAFVDQMSIRYKPASVSAKWYALASFYKYLRRQRLIRADLTEDVRIPQRPAGLPKALDADVVAGVLNEMRAHKDFRGLRARAALELGYAAMARESDLLGAKLSDFDFERRTLRVVGKGNKEAVLMFGAEAREAILEYLKERARFARPGIENLFIKDDGRPLKSLYNVVKKYTGSGSHVFFRHSPATHMIDNGADISVVCEAMRHSSIKTTTVYTKLTNTKLRRQYEKYHPRA